MVTLNASTLPPFEPTKKVVQCSTGPMTALTWAFSSCIPPMARSIFAQAGGASDESLRTNATPAMQWNYSMLHLAHNYEGGLGRKARKFMITDESMSESILLEVTSLRACPEDVKDMNVLERSKFTDPWDKEQRLGALPLFFVRYFHVGQSGHLSMEAVEFAEAANNEGGVMRITAVSIEEIKFAHEELKRGSSLLGETTKKRQFNNSVLFPAQINKIKTPKKAPYVCASCAKIITKRPAPSCSICKVTYYCGRDCQVTHWKSGGHKKICGKAPIEVGSKTSGSRKSFVFDIEDAKPPSQTYVSSLNHKTGNLRIAGMNKEQRLELNKGPHKYHKMPGFKNVHGDKEFIVKLQPPAGSRPTEMPWMCYDGPTRSFQAYIPADTTGLMEVYALLQRDGVATSNPMLGVSGYKGYFMAVWEGSSVRVFYDRVVSPQAW